MKETGSLRDMTVDVATISGSFAFEITASLVSAQD